LAYNILLEPDAILDIQEAIDYYDQQQAGLGKKFETVLNKHFATLQQNPFFQIRYDRVHCLPLKNYPYMIHFTIGENEEIIIVRAVLHTALSPKKWKR
jgi:toxin ParE1/3/4